MLVELAALVDRDPSCVAVHGGNELTRVLLSEEARLIHGRPAVLIDPDLDLDGAVTAVLSGRTDLVAVPAEVASGWSGAA